MITMTLMLIPTSLSTLMNHPLWTGSMLLMQTILILMSTSLLNSHYDIHMF